MVDDIFNSIPGVTVVLSTLLRNRDQDACTEKVSQQIQSLMGVYENARIGLADIRSVMSMNDLSSDGTHPNYGGYKLFAGVWWNAISRLENNIQPPATVTGMNDAMVDSSKTCKKVAGNAGAAVQSQLGSGHDDGNYVHDSSAHGALENIDGDGRADFCLLQSDGTVICSRNGGQGDNHQWQGFSTPDGIRGSVFDKNKGSKSGIVLGR
ncbi:hypothetical protein ACMFMF_010334 [Clarireedia jacksonii]